MIHTLVQFNATYTSEGASVAKCDKNITTVIDCKLISHGSLYCRIPPFTKGKAQLSQKQKLQGNCLVPVRIYVERAIG